MTKKDKELTIDAKDITADPAVVTLDEVSGVPFESDSEAPKGTALEYHGEALPQEVVQSGVGIGFTSGVEYGSSLGIAGEKDEANNSMQKKSE